MPGINFPASLNAEKKISSAGSQVDPQTLRRAQGYLLLIIHSHNCPEQGESNFREQCQYAKLCKFMKTALNHMKTCKKDYSCMELICGPSRRLMSHWRNCTNPQSCFFCAGVKNILERRKQSGRY